MFSMILMVQLIDADEAGRFFRLPATWVP